MLKPGGAAVLVFSHPCFPQGNATVSEDGREVSYRWDFPYFEPTSAGPAVGHFKDEFLWFHRPLSDYWKAFVAPGSSWASKSPVSPRTATTWRRAKESRNSKAALLGRLQLRKPPSTHA